jgi:hypothetical protein
MSKAARGPETARVSLPARATPGFPLTGAASSAVPRGVSWSRTCRDASADTVEQSTSTDGAAGPDIRPPGPSTTEMRSSDEATVANTMSRSPRSAGEETSLAPSFSSGSARARVRL